jgi:phospholipase C
LTQVIVFNFEEWGGFFDHVAPPCAAAPNTVDADVVGGKTLPGFRLPVVIAPPLTRGDVKNPRISSSVYDHTSVLKMIEWCWGLAQMTARDASSDINNLAYALNFNQPQTAVPSLPTPLAPAIAVPCFQNAYGLFSAARNGSSASPASSGEKWGELQTLSAKYGSAAG